MKDVRSEGWPVAGLSLDETLHLDRGRQQPNHVLGQDVGTAAEAVVVMEGLVAGGCKVVRGNRIAPCLLRRSGVFVRIRERVSRDTDIEGSDQQ